VSTADHWNRIYATKDDRDVSWFEPLPVLSLRMMEDAGLTADSCVLDVGGGNSRLVDTLLDRGMNCLAVLDVSAVALDKARQRLGPRATQVTWIVADVTGQWSLEPMEIWHDRAGFHFLTAPADRQRYVGHLRETLKAGGSAIIATFALDGPEKCSGLPAARYSPQTLAAELGPDFTLVDAQPCEHTTPWGARQSFQYSRFRRQPAASGPA
jgi:SAM-dependent methyltransferase